MWCFGLICLEVFTDADPYFTFQDYYVPVLLSKGIPPEHLGTAAVGLSSKMWELMQSCWEVDPAARPDMLKIQQAIRDILPRVEPRPTMAPPQSYRSSPSSQPTLASDFLGRMSPTSSESDILTISEPLDEGIHPTLI